MKLILVYNANSGALNAVLDSVHKIVSPSTYNCNLCAITFGNFGEDGLWRSFRENVDLEMVFLHKDEFVKQYKSKWLPKFEFPIVLMETTSGLEVVLSSEILNDLTSSEELIEALNKLLKLENSAED